MTSHQIQRAFLCPVFDYFLKITYNLFFPANPVFLYPKYPPCLVNARSIQFNWNYEQTEKANLNRCHNKKKNLPHLHVLVNRCQNGQFDRKRRRSHVSYRFHAICPPPQQFLLYAVQRCCISPFLASRATSSISLIALKVYYSNCSFTIAVSMEDSNMLT